MLTFLFILLAVNWLTTIICSTAIGWLIWLSYDRLGSWEGVSMIMESKAVKRLSVAILITTIAGLLLVQTSYIILLNS